MVRALWLGGPLFYPLSYVPARKGSEHRRKIASE